MPIPAGVANSPVLRLNHRGFHYSVKPINGDGSHSMARRRRERGAASAAHAAQLTAEWGLRTVAIAAAGASLRR